MKVEEFLRKWRLGPDAVDMGEVCRKMEVEMARGLYTKDSGSSLPMIPTFFSDDSNLVPGRKAIVLDAGGTNLRTCLVEFDSNLQPLITDFQKTKMPGLEREVSKKEFFSVMADNVQRLIPKSRSIGFCFSYAARITRDLDGIPLAFSKEIKAPEVIGERLGRSLLEECAARGLDVSGHRICVLNDAVATLLAGRTASGAGREHSAWVGYILGTGTNTAYAERTAMIGKLEEGERTVERMVINLESGNFSLELGPMDELFRATTRESGRYKFEKMISGAYLGPLSAMAISKAVEEGVFSKAFAGEFENIGELDTIRMSNFLERPFDMDSPLSRAASFDDADRRSLFRLLDAFIARAAKLTACNLAAVVLKTGEGRDPSRPVCVNADGTTFYKTWNLRRYTDFYLYDYLTRGLGLNYEFVRIPDSPVIGAATAALAL